MSNDIAKEVARLAEKLGVDRKRSIGEVADEIGVKPHVIRFWEENFSQIKPEHGSGGRRYYYNKQLDILRTIKKFLYEDGYTIAGLRKLLNKKNRGEFLERGEQEIEAMFGEDDYDAQDHEERASLDDFIDDEHEIAIDYDAVKNGGEPEMEELEDEEDNEINFSGVKINRDTKLLNFADINISNVDSKAKEEAARVLVRVKNNLENLKKILR